jgi:hypothetical protein
MFALQSAPIHVSKTHLLVGSSNDGNSYIWLRLVGKKCLHIQPRAPRDSV